MKGSKVSLVFVVILVVVFLFSAASPTMAAPDDTVRIWVSYKTGTGKEVLKSLKNANAKVHFDFPELEAYVVTLPSAALNGILNNPHVIDFEEDAERYPIADMASKVTAEALAVVDQDGDTIPYGIDMVQARDVWDANRDGAVDTGAPTGSNRTLCIIDSGYYQDHEDLPNADDGFSQMETEWYVDGFGHGSHVGGTIAAENNGLGVVGVTPGTVNLYIVKFFGDDGLATYASNLVDALNRCQTAGANVVSMSLGGSRSVRTEKTAFANAYTAGVLSIAAAGNAGTSAYSYPASYDSVVSVAAIDSNKVVADFSQYNSQVEVAAPGVAVLSTLPYLESNTVAVDGVTYSGNYIDFAARGSATGALVDGGLCGTAGSWSGKVVLCERGTYDFYTKVMSVQNGGGVAAVIYNNLPGGFLGTLGDGNSSNIVAVSLSQEDGQYLVANKLGRSATVSSSVTKPASGYEAWDGTSMATPHVSAVAALVWSANPTWTNAQIRTALQASAQDLGAAGKDVYYGYGLVQAKAALDYLGGGTPPENTPPTANFTYGVSDLTVSFSDTSTDSDGTIVAWSWNFGDGSTSNLQNPVHLYAEYGTYSVSLTVTDDDGAVGTTSKTVTLSQAGQTVTVSSLIGTSSTVNRNFWKATVTATIDPALAGAVVSGTWSTGASASCTTDSAGKCAVAVNVKTSVGSITFMVNSVTLSGYEYVSGVTTETVNKP